MVFLLNWAKRGIPCIFHLFRPQFWSFPGKKKFHTIFFTHLDNFSALLRKNLRKSSKSGHPIPHSSPTLSPLLTYFLPIQSTYFYLQWNAGALYPLFPYFLLTLYPLFFHSSPTLSPLFTHSFPTLSLLKPLLYLLFTYSSQFFLPTQATF